MARWSLPCPDQGDPVDPNDPYTDGLDPDDSHDREAGDR